MRAVTINGYGGTEVLEVTDVPAPEPGPEEVLVEVRASALNRADLLQRMGLYPAPGPRPDHEIPGMEYSGTVTGVGDRVTSFVPGDQVMGIVAGGAQAEYVVAHERLVMPIPRGVDPADAAAIPEVFITAFDALVAQGGLTSGRRALVHAGASGVGTAAIQIVKALGGFIAVTCSGPKVAACRELGADLVVDYTTESFAEAVSEWTSGNGVDVVLDVIGGDYLVDNLRSCRIQGRVIQVGIMGEGSCEVPLGLFLARRVALIGTTLRARPLEQKAAITQRVIAEVLPLFETGDLKPVIDSRFGLEEIRAAHAHMASNANVGKILVDVS